MQCGFLVTKEENIFVYTKMGSLHIQLMLEFLKPPFLVLHFTYSTFMTFLMVLSVILLSVLMILLSTQCVIRHLIWQQLELASELESDLQQQHCELGQEMVH